MQSATMGLFFLSSFLRPVQPCKDTRRRAAGWRLSETLCFESLRLATVDSFPVVAHGLNVCFEVLDATVCLLLSSHIWNTPKIKTARAAGWADDMIHNISSQVQQQVSKRSRTILG